MKYLYKKIPKIDELLNLENVKKSLKLYPREFILEILRDILNIYRQKIKNGENIEINLNIISNVFDEELHKKSQKNLKRVINATGVIIHTNLGRSKMCKDAINHIVEVAENYSTLEYDLENGIRGSRYSHVEDIICKILGCEAALVVNNNAAAIMIVLDTLCKNTEVIVSRGELVEIGGSFRIPEVMKFSGVILKEVGCTNRTHLFDYENEITENTSAFLKVHTSNYYIDGFVKNVKVEELNVLKNKYNKIIIEDIGSGTIVDFSKYKVYSEEDLVQNSLKNGADIVTFSGDKMLGGPQAGIIVGKKDLIEKIKKNHLLRALRIDKFTLAALESTFRCYLDEKYAIENIPTLKMITYKEEDLKFKAEQLLDLLKDLKEFSIEVEENFSIVGGGSMPKTKLKTYVLDLKHDRFSPEYLEVKLRNSKIPIIVRLEKNSIKLDVRTIEEDEFKYILESLVELRCY